MTEFQSGGPVSPGVVPYGMYGLGLPPHVAPPHPMADPPTEPIAPPRRRIRGLQIRALPTVPLVTQVGGGAAAMAGVWLAFGTAVALIVGGVAAAALGALREAGKI